MVNKCNSSCRICNVKCLSEVNCRMHYNGRGHRAKFEEVLEAVKEAKQPTQSIPVGPTHACG